MTAKHPKRTSIPAIAPKVSALIVSALLAAVALAPLGGAAPVSWAKAPPALAGPIATVGNRSVEAVDIQRAAGALGYDPPRGMTAKAWRRTLLDRCVDRELLGAEAERRGLPDDPDVKRERIEREYGIFMQVLYEKDLFPGIVPKPAEFDSIKASGHYRWLDLYYILLRDDATGSRRPVAEKITERARLGARWDSLAKIYSGHPPSAAAGGHFGPILVKELEPVSQDSIAHASPGSVFGPYSGPYGHEVYKVGGWFDMDDDSLMRLLVDERTRQIYQYYWDRVLKKYHFAVDSLNAARAMTILRSETPDSILASLSPDGTRKGLGVRTEVGIVARADGETVTIADIIRRSGASTNQRGLIRVRDRREFDTLAGRVLLHGLVVRDARDRGFDKDPAVARRLRLVRDETATKTMVARARPADPSPAVLADYIQKNASRYQKPAMRIARVAMFADADSARAALRAWNGIGFPPDSTLNAMGLRVRATGPVEPQTLFPGQTAIVAVPEASSHPLSLSLRALAPGQFAPATRLVSGWAVAMMTGREESAPLSEKDAAPRALRDWREEMENRWVTELLERLRAETPVKVVPARLDAVRITPTVAATKGKQAVR
ncbi:MAG TPA: peptidylprolyl isomerase [Candidatus Eisenbacteria bacterium]|nr:peptidylprolyl isomerase [Candidatus Eisenbacteria bacterium]